MESHCCGLTVLNFLCSETVAAPMADQSLGSFVPAMIQVAKNRYREATQALRAGLTEARSYRSQLPVQPAVIQPP